MRLLRQRGFPALVFLAPAPGVPRSMAPHVINNTYGLFFYDGDGDYVAAYPRDYGHADETSPKTASFKDRETGTCWTLADRSVDGPLKGREPTWVRSLQRRWFAWAAEYPRTLLYEAGR